MRRAKRSRRWRRIPVRPCRASDVEQVVELWRRAAAEPSVNDRPDALRRRLGRDRNLFVLAWDRERLVASLIGGWDGWRGHLYRLAVDPECRRRGIARRLVENVEARLRSFGAKAAELENELRRFHHPQSVGLADADETAPYSPPTSGTER